ncbi:UDP-N-acetylmuramate dehydrogenase, partial [Candidatus Berkelbacteria bacterium]|nr:UDP-N-acetylmuramate dehydrogenase [Candidatus Berkelbacteria bacterium]
VGDAQAADVRALIDSVRQRVFDKCNVMLEDALDYIGEW